MNKDKLHIDPDDERDLEKNLFNKMGKENIFKTPDGFFDEMPDLISDRIIELENNKQQSWFSVFRRKRIVFSALVPLLLILAYFSFLQPAEPLEKMNATFAMNYVEENLASLDEEDFFDLYAETEYAVADSSESNIDFLLEEGIDLDDYIDEL